MYEIYTVYEEGAHCCCTLFIFWGFYHVLRLPTQDKIKDFSRGYLSIVCNEQNDKHFKMVYVKFLFLHVDCSFVSCTLG